VLLLPPVSRDPPLLLPTRRGRVLRRLPANRVPLLLLLGRKLLALKGHLLLLAISSPLLLLQSSKPLVLRVLHRPLASRMLLLLLQGSRRLVRKVFLWLKSHLRLLLHRGKHLL